MMKGKKRSGEIRGGEGGQRLKFDCEIFRYFKIIENGHFIKHICKIYLDLFF